MQLMSGVANRAQNMLCQNLRCNFLEGLLFLKKKICLFFYLIFTLHRNSLEFLLKMFLNILFKVVEGPFLLLYSAIQFFQQPEAS